MAEEINNTTSQPMSATTPPPAQPQTPSTEPRNFLATFLLTIFGGVLGLRHFYLGQKTLGWLRLTLFISSIAMFIASAATTSLTFLAVAGLIFTAAWVWSIVDVFVVYFSVKTDASGVSLLRTDRDSRWAKVIMIITSIFMILSLISVFFQAFVLEDAFKTLMDDEVETLEDLDFDSLFEDLDSDFDSSDFELE